MLLVSAPQICFGMRDDLVRLPLSCMSVACAAHDIDKSRFIWMGGQGYDENQSSHGDTIPFKPQAFALLWLRLDDDKRLVVYCLGNRDVVERLVVDLAGGRLRCLTLASVYARETDHCYDRYVFVAIFFSK